MRLQTSPDVHPFPDILYPHFFRWRGWTASNAWNYIQITCYGWTFIHFLTYYTRIFLDNVAGRHPTPEIISKLLVMVGRSSISRHIIPACFFRRRGWTAYNARHYIQITCYGWTFIHSLTLHLNFTSIVFIFERPPYRCIASEFYFYMVGLNIHLIFIWDILPDSL